MAITMPSQLCWELYMDGAANPRGSGIGIVTISPARITIKKPLRLDFSTTNNKVEYEALITSLDSVKNLKGQSIIVSCDRRLVVRQVWGQFEAKDLRMHLYLGQVKQLQTNFKTFTINQVSRSKNTHTYSFATLVTSKGEGLSRIIIVDSLTTSSYGNRAPIPVSSMRVGLSWMDLVVLFIKNRIFLEDKLEAKKSQRKAPRY